MTLATFLRIGLVLQVGVGAALALWLFPGRLWLAIAVGLLVPLVASAIGLAVQFAVGLITDPRTPALTGGALVSVWWTETAISTRMFSLAQPFAATFPEPTWTRDPSRPAVVLIHGYLCNRAVWRALLESGELDGCNVATVDLEPILGSIDDYADVVRDRVEQLRAATGASQVVLVGHSMGGLAIRTYLRKFGHATVAQVITLATPHHGTVFGRLGMGINGKQMAVGSAFTRELAQAWSSALAAKFLCIAARDDNLIVPRSSPLLPGARQVEIDRVGHLALIEDKRAWRILREELRAPRAA